MKKDNETMLRLDWSVDQLGYELVESMEEQFRGNTGEPYIGPATYIKGKGGPKMEYSPFSGKYAIHRDLAHLNEDKSDGSDVLSFCGKYGLLDHSLPANELSSENSSVNFRFRATGELMQGQEMLSLEFFWFHQRDVRDAVLALDNGDKLEAIRLFNDQIINVVPKINLEKFRQHRPWQLIPRTLISAIWLLVEQEISGGTQWQRCQTCQEWFTPRTIRAKYCKDACKTAWYRKKKKEKTDGN